MQKMFGSERKFALPLHRFLARIAQLVEHDLAKVGVASSSLVSRSFFLRSFEVVKSVPWWRNR